MIGDYDVVIHIAARLDKREDAAEEVFRKNAEGDAKRPAPVREGAAFIYASTKTFTARTRGLARSARTAPSLTRGQSALEWSKLIGERYVEYYAERRGFRACVFRLSTVYARPRRATSRASSHIRRVVQARPTCCASPRMVRPCATCCTSRLLARLPAFVIRASCAACIISAAGARTRPRCARWKRRSLIDASRFTTKPESARACLSTTSPICRSARGTRLGAAHGHRGRLKSCCERREDNCRRGLPLPVSA